MRQTLSNCCASSFAISANCKYECVCSVWDNEKTYAERRWEQNCVHENGEDHTATDARRKQPTWSGLLHCLNSEGKVIPLIKALRHITARQAIIQGKWSPKGLISNTDLLCLNIVRYLVLLLRIIKKLSSNEQVWQQNANSIFHAKKRVVIQLVNCFFYADLMPRQETAEKHWSRHRSNKNKNFLKINLKYRNNILLTACKFERPGMNKTGFSLRSKVNRERKMGEPEDTCCGKK